MKLVIALKPNEFSKEFNYQLAPYEEWIRQDGRSKNAYSSILSRWLTSRIELPKIKDGNLAYLFFTGGGSIRQGSFPHYVMNEIIPMIWDCWPGCIDLVAGFLKRKDVKTSIFTSSMTAVKIQKLFPYMNVLFVPEAVNVKSYFEGDELEKREIDLLEYGRAIKLLSRDNHWDDGINHVYNQDGRPIFSSSEVFRRSLSNSKIALTFPRCDTQPEIAGDVETLTQRYWENMLSRVVMLGRAPKELIDLLGYNPVVEIDKGKPEEQVLDIIRNIGDYQSLVDKNRIVALEKGDWSLRINTIRSFLKRHGYNV